ncbi:hypothetical protein IHK62_005116 [Escherichia coli]|nr:hypothetical protein [Escherichia coli]
MKESTEQALTALVKALKEEEQERPFDFADIPDFPDDFNVDDMNKIWQEMNK